MYLKIPKEYKDQIIESVQWYFEREKSEQIGELAAWNFAEYMLKQLGPIIYNQAVADAQTVLMQQMERADEELDALRQPIRLTR